MAALERRIARWFYVITQSDSMITELETMGVAAEKRTNVHDGVDTAVFTPRPVDRELAARLGIDESKPRVLYMGLFAEYQGTDVMLEAFKQVAGKNPRTQFLMIGFPDIEKYRAAGERLGIGENMKFLGRVDYEVLPRYLSLSPVAVAPKIAITEGDGKIYNYMAMGMATVAFDRSVSREILGDTGLYAALGDPRALAEKILWALDHPEDSRILGQKSRERAIGNLSWDAVGRRIDEVYRRL